MKNKLQTNFLLVNSTIGISQFFYPKNNNFKNSLALFFVVMGMSFSWGQIFIEDFNYQISSILTTTSTPDATTSWLSHSGNGTANIDITNGLTFSGFAGSGIGGAANLDNNGQDINKTFSSQTSGIIYASMLVNTQSTNSAGYFFMFSPSPVNSTFYSRIYVNGTGTGVGISGSSAPSSYITISSTTTVLLCIKFDFSTQVSSLYVLNTFSATEPSTASQTFTENSVTTIGAVALRQFNANQRIIIDGIRVGSSWASVTSPTNNWIGGTGNWSTTTNWSLGAVPQSTDNITISTGNPSMDVDYTLNTGRTLTISGTGGLTINSGKTITISGAADFGGKPVLIKSDSNGSGAVGPVLGTLIGATNVTVERFIPSKRAWRALTSPVISTTNNSIFYNWQNNGTVTNGVGVELWGTAGTGNSGNGLSVGASNSILQYNNTGTSGAWNSISNTKTTNLFDGNINNAFMIFVTGPYATTSTNISGGSADTTLKATGQLIVGSKTYANLPSGVHTLIGNPYASSISPLLLLNGNTSFGDNIWIWDAKATNNNSVGAFNSFDRVANRYTNITNTTLTPTTPDIQSGQAFFVKAISGTANLTITEGFKLGTTSANTIFKTGISPEIIRLGLYKQENNEWSGRDGAMEVVFSEAEVNQATNKMTNGSENIAFTKNGVLFASEHHLPLVHNDILNIKVWNLTVGSNYKLKIHTEDFVATNLQATLEDLYTNTRSSISLNGSVVEYPFTVTTDALSTGDRFRIVFQTVVLGMNNQLGKSFSIFPNPVIGDFFQVNLGTLPTGNYSYTICNSIGQEVEKGSFENISQNTNFTIRINNIVSGIYFMKIKGSNSSVFISKIIKN
jgi:hypothetical protein